MTRIKSFSRASMLALALVVIGIPSLTHAALLTRQLEITMSGTDVSSLQTFLALDTTIYPQGLVTGYFGVLTQAAVRNFQARNGIDTVGRVGPITMAAINAQMMNGGSTGGDVTAPTISSLNINPTRTGATFNWNTNEGAAAIVYYGITPLVVMEAAPGTQVNISGATILANTSMITSHTATLTALQPNTTYYYVVYVRDGSNNTTVTGQSTFKTTN